VREAWSTHDTGTITAYRDFAECGDGERYTSKQKNVMNRFLKSKLLKRGYGVTKVKGSWFENGDTEVNEASFFVVDLKDSGNLKSDLIALGTEFDQDAITFAEVGGDFYAVSTNECEESWPGFGKIGKEEKLGSPKFGKTGINGFSRVNNRAFVFEGYKVVEQETLSSHTPTSIRSIMHIDDVDWRDVILKG
jgi:hypothetical protein